MPTIIYTVWLPKDKTAIESTWIIYIYIYFLFFYAFSRCFYPKRLTLHSSYSLYILLATYLSPISYLSPLRSSVVHVIFIPYTVLGCGGIGGGHDGIVYWPNPICDPGPQNQSYQFFENWINQLFIDVWFVRIRQYLAEIQLFEYLESGVAKKSKYWENHL